MKRYAQFGIWLGLLLLLVGISLPAGAQGGGRRQSRQSKSSASASSNNSGNQGKQAANGGNNGQKGNQNPGANPNSTSGPNAGGNRPGNGRAGAGVPPRFIEQLRGMTPEQQERFLTNNARFQNMPPQEQAQIRQTMQRWNNLSPEQQSVMRARQAAIQQMTPQEQQYVHQVVQPTWRDMPPGQRRFMQQHLRQLYGMSAPEAQAKLSDPAFLRGMTPEQQKMIPYLYRMRVGAAPEPPQGPPEY